MAQPLSEPGDAGSGGPASVAGSGWNSGPWALCGAMRDSTGEAPAFRTGRMVGPPGVSQPSLGFCSK